MQPNPTITRERLVDYVPLDSLHAVLEAQASRVLGVATYGADAFRAGGAGGLRLPAGAPPLAAVSLAPLVPAHGLAELWLTEGAQQCATIGPVQCAWSDELLFGAVSWPLSGYSDAGAATPLHQAAHGIYEAIFAALRATGFPHLLRVWNYFPAINREAGEPGGLERYRQFNLGRAEAFINAGAHVAEGAPAACALGSPHGDLELYFLALREAPLSIENPRQVSAYHYPAEYGPRSPSFSRAALATIGGAPRLLISGTASIVGHATAHVGDVAAQARESLANVEAVVAEANRALGAQGGAPYFAVRDLALKTYVRHPADLPIIRRELEGALGPTASVIYLQADICRADLLVEIEACG
jgi:enamine deaminase RidA (YjgF/YER057c/UK114 family)